MNQLLKPLPTAALATLLVTLFAHAEEIKRFIENSALTTSLVASLPSDTVPPDKMAHDIVRALESRGMVTPQFFAELVSVRPLREGDILRVEDLWKNRSNPVDVAAEVVDEGSHLEDLVQEVLKKLDKVWASYEERQRPTEGDVRKGLAKFTAAYHRANNHSKRKILWNAFWSTFKPEFYSGGTANILWDKVEELEYPDFAFLDKVVKSCDPTKRTHMHPHSQRGMWRGDQMPIWASDDDAEFASRLQAVGLVEIEPGTANGVWLISRRGLAAKVKAFALEELWNEDGD